MGRTPHFAFVSASVLLRGQVLGRTTHSASVSTSVLLRDGVGVGQNSAFCIRIRIRIPMVGGECWAGLRILHPHPYSELYRRGGGSGPGSVFRIRIRIPYLRLGPSSVFRIRIRISYSRELGPDPYSVSVSVFRILVSWAQIRIPYPYPYSVFVSWAQVRIPYPYRIPYSCELGPDPYFVSVSVFRICVLGQVP